MAILRQIVGETLRALRLRQRRTLREVSTAARVSLGYLSEVERGQKEPSSELLAAICSALDVELSELFAQVSQSLQREERLALVTSVNRLPGTALTHLDPAAAALPEATGGTGAALRTPATAAA